VEQQSVRKTFKYRLKPTPDQERLLERTLMLCRHVYNAAVEERREAWQKCGVSVTSFRQKAELPGIKEAMPEYAEVNAQVLQDVVQRVDRAFQAFFRRVESGETPGYPRFHGRDRYNSVTHPQVGEHGGAVVYGGILSLSKIGRIPIRLHRPLEGRPKTVTISREVDGWYVCFSCVNAPVQPLPTAGQETGLDLAIEAFATPSHGTRIFSPGWYRKAERALKMAQRRVSRRKRGGNRRRRAIVLLAKAHQKVRRQRRDFHHKTALALVQANDAIYHEALQPANRVKHHHLAKSISDAGWSAFLIILTHKAAWAGRRIVAVNPAYTSQTCSGCGVVVQKGLSVRWHSCPNCGMSLHRDHNAAKNIERAGQALRGGVAFVASENREAPGFSRGEHVTKFSIGSPLASERKGEVRAVWHNGPHEKPSQPCKELPTMPNASGATHTTTQTATPALDLNAIRAAFPSLGVEMNEQPVVYFDNPGGTQVPQACIDAITQYLSSANANTGGAFLTSQRTDAVLAEAHTAMADFLNAADPREIVFGANMTTLTFAFSRAIGRTLKPGDEIVVTALDHDGNSAPWLALQEERGVVVRMANFDPATCTLDMDDLRSKINEKTRLVAVGYASNAVGTINDVATIIAWAREVGAMSFIDAVQFAPHGPIDVQALGCDFLACSAYKFFSTHLGVLYGRLPLLESIAAYKVRPAQDTPPYKWETGTLNHECLAGLVGTISYLTELGSPLADQHASTFPGMTGRRLELHSAMAAMQAYERTLAARLLAGLATIPGILIYGLTSEEDLVRRVPTVAITLEGWTPRALAEELAERGIFCWDGNYYALTLMERLGLEEHGGALRIGMTHYNTAEEIDRLLVALREFAAR
jgi:cysteine desulfurase family protein (TIGR01976 family)